DRLPPEIGVGLLRAEEAAIHAARLEAGDARGVVERAGLGPPVELQAIGRDAVRAGDEEDVPGGAHAIGVGEQLPLVCEQLDVVAVDADLPDQLGVMRFFAADGLLAVHRPLEAAAVGSLRARWKSPGQEREQDEKAFTKHALERSLAAGGISEEYHGRGARGPGR